MNSLRTVREARINFLFFQDIITCVMGILILVTLMLSLSLDTGEAATPEESQLQRANENLAQIEQQNRLAQQQRLQLALLPDRSALETELAILQKQFTNTSEQLRRFQERVASDKAQNDRAAAERKNTTNVLQEIALLQKQLAAARDELADARRHTNSVYIVPAPDAQQPAREPVAFIVGDNKIEVKHLNAAISQTHDLSGADDLRPLLSSLDPEREYVVFYFRPSGAKWFEPFRNLARSLGLAVGYDAIEEQKEVIFSNK